MQASKNALSSYQVQSNDDTSANSNQNTTQYVNNQIDESSSNSQQENSLTSSNKNQLNSSSVTPSQSNQVAQSNNQIESKQSSDKKVSTYSNNDNNATQVNVDQLKHHKKLILRMHQHQKQLKHLQVTVHNQVILDLDLLVAKVVLLLQ